LDQAIYKDASQPIEKRVEDLLSRMTLEEKTAQLCGNLPAAVVVNGKVDMTRLREVGKNGHGRFTQYSLVGLVEPEQIAQITNTIQKFFVEETRLGIPVALQTENLCGYPSAGGTLFPAQINLGSTWNPELAERMSEVIGQESRAVGISSAMSPVVDVSRDPRWGRTYETYGEDHYMNSQMGIHYIRGMQGQGVSCIAKHFLGYAESQGGLNTATQRINDRELYEVFATPFEAAVREADVGGMMASYGEIDGMPVGANPKIARTLLRDTMGFKGMLTSDGAAIWKMFSYFKISKTYKEAGLLAKKGGLDTEIPIGGAFRQLPDYVKSGELDEALIDESVRRVLTIKFKCGLFENPYADVAGLKTAMTNPDKQRLSEKIAGESVILLQNKGHLLPLKKGTKIAVIGPHADSLRYPVSGYTYPAYIEMLKSYQSEKGQSVKKDGAGAFSTMFDVFSDQDREKLSDMNTVLREMNATTLKEELEKRFSVRYAEGCKIISHDESGFGDAVKAARESDVVVMALGGNCGWVNVTGGEGKDRCRLDLPGVQQKLLETVEAVGKPVVVILYGPQIFSTPWAVEHTEAILQAYLPGQHGGKVMAEILDGTHNPEGKLTFTVPRSAGQIPVFYNHKTGSGYTSIGDEGAASPIFTGGYVDEDCRPLFPFGYGLSYTTFQLDHFSMESGEIPTDGEIRISCDVRNTGNTAGSEVVQLYYHFSDAHVIRPNRQLIGFRKIFLKAGEGRKVLFTIPVSLLGYYDENMVFGVEPGNAELMIGTSSAHIAQTEKIVLTGERRELLGHRSYTSKTAVTQI